MNAIPSEINNGEWIAYIDNRVVKVIVKGYGIQLKEIKPIPHKELVVSFHEVIDVAEKQLKLL